MYKVKEISIKEKAAIIYSLITGIDDNITFNIIAKGKPEININRESYSNSGSQLKNKEYIKAYYANAQNIIDNYVSNRLKTLQYNNDNDINNPGISKEDGFTLKNINFTNPVEFINYLNSQANTIQDEKTRREYLKMLADLLRFKVTGNDPGNEIQRFYTPQTCQNCMLYNLKADEISTKE